MKIAILVLLACCIASAVSEYTHGDNGQPLCIAEEMTRLWRNNFDPTRFWACQTLNQPGIEVLCENGKAFMESTEQFGCVLWESWQWTEPKNPPSKTTKQ